MEKNAFRRMDYYIEALQDLFEPISGFEGFGESPEEISVPSEIEAPLVEDRMEKADFKD